MLSTTKVERQEMCACVNLCASCGGKYRRQLRLKRKEKCENCGGTVSYIEKQGKDVATQVNK